MSEEKFTAKQLSNWHKFELVRRTGLFNMFDPRARKMSGLPSDEYSYCMKNYSALREAQPMERKSL